MLLLDSQMVPATILQQQSSKSSLDSSFQSLEKITTESFFEINNPIIFGSLLILVILAIIYIFYRFIIIPMKKRHIEEKENLRLEQAELMALFAELSPDPFFRFDEKGVILLANRSAEQILPGENLSGLLIKQLLPSTKELDLETIINKGQKIDLSEYIGDHYYQFIITGVPSLKMGQIYGRDISELKRAEDELKEALTKAENAKKLKEEFLSQISHEIRSPLVVIQGYSELMRNELGDNLLKEYNHAFLAIENNSKRLHRTVDLILNMSQLQTSNYKPKFENLNLFTLLNSLYDEFLSFADEKNMKFEINMSPDCVPEVQGDFYSVVQIFVNLMDNAFKYTEKGEVKININKENQEYNVEVKDTGIGMSEEFLATIYTPFSQEEIGYSRPYEGTGLGLALVKKFVDINNAHIEVRSAKNQGTSFIVKFPGPGNADK